MKNLSRLPICVLAALILALAAAPAAVAETETPAVVSVGRDVTADELVLRGEGDRAVVNAGHIGRLVIGDDAPGEVRVAGGVDELEISGSGRAVTVASPVTSVKITGEDARVNIPWGGSAGRLELTEDSKSCEVKAATSKIDKVELYGTDNAVTLDGGAGEIVLGGVGCRVDGEGEADKLTSLTYRSDCSLPAGTTEDKRPTGLGDLSIDIDTASTIKPGDTLTASATLTNPFPVDCKLSWYLNGELIGDEEAAVGPEETELKLTHRLVFDEKLTDRPEIKLVATAKNAGGVTETASDRVSFGIDRFYSVMTGMKVKVEDAGSGNNRILARARLENPVDTKCLAVWTVNGVPAKSHSVTVGPQGLELTLDMPLESPPASGTVYVGLKLTQGRRVASGGVKLTVGVTPEEALATVTHKYAGDRTLQWALEHDYDENMKTVFVNAKGYESATDRLVWVNLTYQRVNVFKGSKGNWVLEKTFLCGTGASGSGTPVGEYTVWYSQPNGWNHGSYIVRPVVRFNVGSGYAFHSRLWNPSHTRLIDDRIGFPISAGCVRMYDEDAYWMLENILPGTKVVIH